MNGATRETLDAGQIRLAGGADLPPAERLSFVLIAGGSARIAAASLALYPADGRREAGPPAPVRRRGEGDVWTALGRGLWTEGRSAPTIQFWEETPGREQIILAHDGYRRLAGRPIHRRRLRRAGTEWRVVDEITGRGRRQVELRFHLPRAVIAADAEGARAAFPDGCRLRLRVEGWHAPETAVEPGRHALDGRSEEPCPVLVYRWHTRLPFEVETVWEVGQARTEAVGRPAMSGSDETCISLFTGRVRRAAGRPVLSGTGVALGERDYSPEPGSRGESW